MGAGASSGPPGSGGSVSGGDGSSGSQGQNGQGGEQRGRNGGGPPEALTRLLAEIAAGAVHRDLEGGDRDDRGGGRGGVGALGLPGLLGGPGIMGLPPHLGFPLAAEMAASARAASTGMPHFVVISVPGMDSVGAFAAPGIEEELLRLPFGFLAAGGSGPEEGGLSPLDVAMAHAMRVMMERSMNEPQEPQVFPAQEILRDSLPRVVVTKEDQMDATNSKCAVCLEDFTAGTKATRMFCGHLFCTTCIREWLRTANTCPVCRFELATDSSEFEAGRKERMQGRVAKLRGGELRMMRVPELKQLMRALGISGDGCVEKVDLIRKLGSSEEVEVAPDRKDVLYDECELRCLEMPQLRCLLERYALAKCTADLDESQERNEALEKFAAAGWIKSGSSMEAPGGSLASSSTSPAADGPAPDAKAEEEEADKGTPASSSTSPPADGADHAAEREGKGSVADSADEPSSSSKGGPEVDRGASAAPVAEPTPSTPKEQADAEPAASSTRVEAAEAAPSSPKAGAAEEEQGSPSRSLQRAPSTASAAGRLRALRASSSSSSVSQSPSNT